MHYTAAILISSVWRFISAFDTTFMHLPLKKRAGSREMHRALLMLVLCRYMLGIIDVCTMFTYFPIHMYIHFDFLLCMCIH
ncbi:hypothetical protein AB205_0103090 [Aquarana catesbeiana]|uniref:Uncharacterized protein n=1 Tax=Aquarana catesbeiana TaxID=8400 RepID=A0A2G9RQD1_AQUCT|nr:hypothetical protein AB205_0103090 [Aquarana catesbeiana]